MPAYERILVDVDTQFDFLDPGGNLYVPGGAGIHDAIGRLIGFARRSGMPLISTADDHSARDPEYEQFGRHCERGTLGQRKLPFTVLPQSRVIHPEETLPVGPAPLLREFGQLIFIKHTLDVFMNPHLGRLVEQIEAGEYVVFGVATDYCVKTAVEGLLARKAKVAVVTDAIRAIDEQAGQAILRDFAARGVRLIRTMDVLRTLDDALPAEDFGEDE